MTNLKNTQEKTNNSNKTGKTVSNHAFLNAIFGAHDRPEKPMIVSFAGHPHKKARGKWDGEAYDPDFSEMPDHHNNFFSLSSFVPSKNKDKEYERQKQYFAQYYCVMLDDIGTKISMDRIKGLLPSWLLETSKGNFQAGYILKSPISDAKLADQLMKAVIKAGLSDPGANGPATRLARLPVGVNGKTTPPFQCKLKEWHPKRRYTFNELVKGLELDFNQSQSQNAKASHQELYIPGTKVNKVLAALKEARLYKRKLGEGKHDITCPWLDEHTNALDDGAAYFEPNANYPIGGFKCHHGHCEGRNIYDVLDFLELNVQDARMKATIICLKGELHNCVDFAEQELANSGHYYQRGEQIVMLVHDPISKETRIKQISLHALSYILCQVAQWQQYDGRSRNMVKTDPPPRIVSILNDATVYKYLPYLNGIAHQPFMREDGSFMRQVDYDEPSGMYGVFKVNKYTIPDKPSHTDAQESLEAIKTLLAEFPFKNAHDHSAALSAILTAAIRPSLPLAPMYHVRAPQIASGKSFLCEMISVFASPKHSAPISFPKDEDECRKVLLAELIKAPAVIVYDNLTYDIVAHDSLCTALTSEHLSGRILGASKVTSVGTRTLFLSSGNNVGPTKDILRRCITINLDPACENPAQREYKNPNVLTDLKNQREKYVSHALTIIRAWIVAGKPKTKCKALSSYHQWSEYCRQPLLWLEQPDPVIGLFKEMDHDPDRERLGRLLEAWYDAFGSKPKMVRNLRLDRDDELVTNELDEIIEDIAMDRYTVCNRRLGRWIARNAGRVVGNKRLVKASGTYSAAAWQVEVVK